MNTIEIMKIKLNSKDNLIKHHKRHNFYEGFMFSSKKINFVPDPTAIFTAFISTSSTSGFESQKNAKTKIADYKIVFENENQIIINKTSRYINLSISFSVFIEGDSFAVKMENLVSFYNKLGIINYVVLRPLHRYLLKKRLFNIIKIID